MRHVHQGKTYLKHVRRMAGGFSLVEIIIAAALVSITFAALFAGLQVMLQIVSTSKAEAGARSLAVERIEYIRSLAYDDAGTIGGLGPQGNIPLTSTTTLNGIEYTETVLMLYVDRIEDGFGPVDDTIPGIVADMNGIDQDSKRVRVTYSWQQRGTTTSLSLSTDLIPKGIESTAGGGTLLINVFDANIQPVEDAEVRIVNDTLSPAVDTTVTTNEFGIANFPGAPAGSNYQIWATKAGYSTDQTYSVTATNTSPVRTHISVATGTVSTVNFSIDRVSSLTINTVGDPVRTTFVDSFDNDANVATGTDYSVSSSRVRADGGPLNYVATSTAFATTTEPSTIDYWESFDFNATSSANTSARVRLYSTSGVGTATVYTLIPDTDLPFNSLGFVQGPVDIRTVDPSTYPSLAVGVTLTSSSTTETAELYDWELVYVESQPAISAIPMSVVGAKTIGSFGGAPVYKYDGGGTTNGSGQLTLSNLEFDDYTITPTTGSYSVSAVYGSNPFDLEPNVSETVTFVLSSPTTYSMRVEVEDDSGDAIGGADVRLYNGTFDDTLSTSIYGQSYFSTGLFASSTYQIDVNANGYDPVTVTGIDIAGNEQTTITLTVAAPGGGGDTGTTTATTTTSTYLAGYDNRIPISIAGTTLFGSVSDFPVYVDLSDLPSAVFSALQSTGADIRMTTGNGLSEVPFELVSIDTGAETGQLHFKSTLDTSTTSVYYLYYGSSTAAAYADSDTYGAENVWTNNYRAVYHLEEEATGSGNTDVYLDSTSFNAHGDDYIQTTVKEGVLGAGQMFEEDTTDYIELPYTVLDGMSDVTLSFWYRTNNNDYETILSGARNNTSDGANEYLFWFQDRNDIQFFGQGDPRVNFDISNINDDVWRFYTSIRDDGNNQVRLYINASEDNQSPASDSMSTLDIAPGGLFIGVDQDSVGGSFGQYLDDDLDEVRIANTVRSAEWIANVYLNQNSPTSFYSIGSPETE